MERRETYITRILRTFAYFKLLARRIGVQLVLAAWVIPDAAGRLAARCRSGFPYFRTALVLAVAAAVVVPWTLYRSERERRIEIDDAYSQLSLASDAEIESLGHSLQTLLDEQAELRSLLLDAGYSVVSGDRLWMRLLATGYSSRVEETDDTPFITASNTRTRPGVVALSRDILKRYNGQAPFTFGDAIHISGIGDFLVEDSMNPRWRKRLDIWFPSREAAANFGIRRVTVTLPLTPLNKYKAISSSYGSDLTAAADFVSNSHSKQ
jgi:3D (Asp-Asp-Asp) domain-containing protein